MQLIASRGASAAPWTVNFGGCTFSGDTAYAPLVRTGSCPTYAGGLGGLDLHTKGITSVTSNAFQGMSQQMT